MEEARALVTCEPPVAAEARSPDIEQGGLTPQDSSEYQQQQHDTFTAPSVAAAVEKQLVNVCRSDATQRCAYERSPSRGIPEIFSNSLAPLEACGVSSATRAAAALTAAGASSVVLEPEGLGCRSILARSGCIDHVPMTDKETRFGRGETNIDIDAAFGRRSPVHVSGCGGEAKTSPLY